MYKEEAEKIDKAPSGPVILAVETSSRTGSVALARGHVLCEETRFSAPMQHSAEIFPALAGLLERHGLRPSDAEQLHLAIGPGSFTGLRIAVTVAKAMHLAAGTRLVAVDSLDVLAANADESVAEVTPETPDNVDCEAPDRIATVFDAKRGQFYTAIYERTNERPATTDDGYRVPAPGGARWRKTAPDRLMTAMEILEVATTTGAGRFAILGDGLLYHRDKFLTGGIRILPESYWGPRAGNVHRLGYQKALAGRFEDPSVLTPFYLRGPQVTLRRKG